MSHVSFTNSPTNMIQESVVFKLLNAPITRKQGKTRKKYNLTVVTKIRPTPTPSTYDLLQPPKYGQAYDFAELPASCIDILNDSVAFEPRIDSLTSTIWLPPEILQCIDGKLRIPNNTDR